MPTWQAFVGLLLAKWYDNKLVKSPYNCVISPLTQPQVANQKKKKKKNRWFSIGTGNPAAEATCYFFWQN